MSKKKSRIRSEYLRICQVIDNLLMDEFGGIWCSSCHVLLATNRSSIKSWGHSHLLPKGRYPEFEAQMWNISPRCQDYMNWKGCHNALDNREWEKISKFKDLSKIMKTLKEHSLTEYNKFVTGLKSVGIEKYPYIDL